MVLERRSVVVSHRKRKNMVDFHGTMFEQQQVQISKSSSEEEKQRLIIGSGISNDQDGDNNNNNGHDGDNGISEWEAAASIAKAIMGAGSFALPWAFSNIGFVAGPIFMTLLMIFSIFSLKLLILSSRSIQRLGERKQNSYVDVTRAIFGKTGARLTYVASISASMGVCGSYLLFIAANLQSLFLTTTTTTNNNNNVSQGSIVILVLPFAIALSSVRDMKHFAFASLLGDVSVVLGMLVVVIYGFWYHSNNFGRDCSAFGSIETMPLAFGAIGYLFLIHFLVLPIESSMANPENFQTVATKTFTACAILSGSFGVIGYLLFGSDTQQIVLLNVRGSFFVSAVKLLLCVDLLLTYPVVMRPSIVILEQSLVSFKQSTKKMRSKDNRDTSSKKSGDSEHQQQIEWSVHMTACVLLGLVAAGAGIFVPAFGLLSGLVGGVSQTFLAFVLPPLMMLAKKQKQQHINATTTSSSSSSNFLKNGRNEILLVIFGLTLILWTLNSTWNELKKKKE